jgi:hypothetical protein
MKIAKKLVLVILLTTLSIYSKQSVDFKFGNSLKVHFKRDKEKISVSKNNDKDKPIKQISIKLTDSILQLGYFKKCKMCKKLPKWTYLPAIQLNPAVNLDRIALQLDTLLKVFFDKIQISGYLSLPNAHKLVIAENSAWLVDLIEESKHSSINDVSKVYRQQMTKIANVVLTFFGIETRYINN